MPKIIMKNDEDNEFHILKWEGPLDARKIVERMIAAIMAGFFMGIGFYLMGTLFG